MLKRILVFLSLTLILLFSLGFISAEDVSNISDTGHDFNGGFVNHTYEILDCSSLNETAKEEIKTNISAEKTDKNSPNNTIDSKCNTKGNLGSKNIRSNIQGLNNEDVLGVSNNTIYVPGGLSSRQIQSIIDNADSGSVIVFNGTYYSNVILSVSKPVTLLSYKKTKFDSFNRNPVITIKDTSNVLIKGFNIYNEIGNGIDITDSSDINVSSNNITTSKIGINSENVVNLIIENNRFTDNGNYALIIALNNHSSILNNTFSSNSIAVGLSDSDNTGIVGNIINKNRIGIYGDSELNGLIYGQGPSNIRITDNIITYNTAEGINLNKAGNGIHIYNNTITHNGDNGIRLNEVGNIRIKSNVIRSNDGSGIKFAKDYIAPKTQDISSNIIVANTFREVDAHESSYDFGSERLVIGNNWFGSSDSGRANICPKIKAGLISMRMIQVGNYLAKIVFYNPDGTIATGLPAMTGSYKSGDGRSHSFSTNGSGSSTFLHVDSSEGSFVRATVDYEVSSFEYKLNQPGYIPDDNRTYDPNHVISQEDVNRNYRNDHPEGNTGNNGNGKGNGNGTSTNNGNSRGNANNGNGGNGQNSNNGISGSNTGSNGFVGISSVASSIASSSSGSSSPDTSSSTGASESGSDSSSSSSSGDSQSIKYLEIDEDNITHLAGEFFVVLLIIIGVYIYYRKSIKELKNS